MAYPAIPYRGVPGFDSIGTGTAIISDIVVELEDVAGVIDYDMELTQTINVTVELD